MRHVTFHTGQNEGTTIVMNAWPMSLKCDRHGSVDVDLANQTSGWVHGSRFALLTLPQQAHLAVTMCADGFLGPNKKMEGFSDFYSAELMLKSRHLANPSHPMQGMSTIITF